MKGGFALPSAPLRRMEIEELQTILQAEIQEMEVEGFDMLVAKRWNTRISELAQRTEQIAENTLSAT